MWAGNREIEHSAVRVAELGTTVWRARWFLCAWMAIWAAAGVGYIILVKPEFVSTVEIVLEPRHVANDGPEDERHYHQLALDSEQVDTELHVLRSEGLLRGVFDQLNLQDSPELASGQNGFWSATAHLLHRLVPNLAPYDASTRAFYAFADRVRCLRLGLSYVIMISYRSRDPVRAAQVANAVAMAYIGDRLAHKRAQIDRTGAYRASRVAVLAKQIEAARQSIRTARPPANDLYYSDVRLLGAATPPLAKAFPKTGPTVIFALGFGLISGLTLVLFFRRGRSVPLARRNQRWLQLPVSAR
ncbi:MAG: hypothetical protein P4L82_00195 [Ancalomicrobiaceae bacterium]|nr:hypothetical protein [Ancalomicrobiaceae bacterium]